MPNKSIMVIGLSRLGSKIAGALLQDNYKLTIFEKKEGRIKNFLGSFPHANVINTDVTDDNFATSQNLGSYSCIILTILSAVDDSLNVANQIQKVIKDPKNNYDSYFIACAIEPHHYDLLSKIGIKNIVRVTEVVSNYLVSRVKHRVKTTNFQSINNRWGWFGIDVPALNSDHQLTLSKLGLYNARSDLIFTGILRDQKMITVNKLSENSLLQPKDQIIVAGEFEQVKKLEAQLDSEQKAALLVSEKN